MVGSHVFPHEVSTFIYIYIYIDFLFNYHQIPILTQEAFQKLKEINEKRS